jgi:lycopene cyclase domain-containing protein
MNQKYLYLAINCFTVIVPFIASFYPRAPFFKKWKYLLPAILFPGLFFLIWDEYFTTIGVWGFNDRYLTGLKLGHLPLEEVLFFICIPYACVFTYFALRHLIQKDYLKPYQRKISLILIVALFAIGVSFIGRAYTSTSFLFLALFIAFEEYYRKAEYISRFYFTYIVLLFPFVIVNGILTGSFIEQEVVWYNNDHNLGVRLGTIPIEDMFYGMLLLMMNVSLFTRLSVGKESI